MARVSARTQRAPELRIDQALGTIVSIDPEGRAYVTHEHSSAPALARSAIAADSAEDWIGARVLLCFENGDPGLPIVLGVVRESLRPTAPVLSLETDSIRDVLVDGRRLVFEAREEIVLRCGKSTVVLQRDGKVLVRGAHVVSRSSGPNKIKGGSISLN